MASLLSMTRVKWGVASVKHFPMLYHSVDYIFCSFACVMLQNPILQMNRLNKTKFAVISSVYSLFPKDSLFTEHITQKM